MKKLLSLFVLFLMSATMSNAIELLDIPADHWAAKEIVYVIREGIIPDFEDNTFRPKQEVRRAEFNSMLLRTLGHKQTDAATRKQFSDVTDSYWAYADIQKSEKLGLLYGYPDNTFRPDSTITKNEVASIISHITKNEVQNVDILKQFADYSEIPSWGVKQYAKTIELGIYVNYPDLAYLLPNKKLNRAEAAVLLYRLRMAMGLVKEEYVAKEVVTGVEHLRTFAGAPNNKVTVTNYRKIVQKGNVLPVAFAEKYNSKRSNVGGKVKFAFTKDVVTEEGSLLIPNGSVATATVATLDKQRAFNKNAKVTLSFDSVTLPSGETYTLSGRVYENDGVLTESRWKKVTGYTLSGAAIGTGLGLAIGGGLDDCGKGLAIGLPVGAGVGLLTGLVTPGVAYKANDKEELNVLLLEDFVLGESL